MWIVLVSTPVSIFCAMLTALLIGIA